MNEALAFATTASALLTAAAVVVRVALGGSGWRSVAPLVVTVQVATLVQAGLVLAAVATGARPGEPATCVCYLAVSVLVLPVALAAGGRDEGRWAGLLLAVALVVLAVVVVRLQTTWRHG